MDNDSITDNFLNILLIGIQRIFSKGGDDYYKELNIRSILTTSKTLRELMIKYSFQMDHLVKEFVFVHRKFVMKSGFETASKRSVFIPSGIEEIPFSIPTELFASKIEGRISDSVDMNKLKQKTTEKMVSVTLEVVKKMKEKLENGETDESMMQHSFMSLMTIINASYKKMEKQVTMSVREKTTSVIVTVTNELFNIVNEIMELIQEEDFLKFVSGNEERSIISDIYDALIVIDKDDEITEFDDFQKIFIKFRRPINALTLFIFRVIDNRGGKLDDDIMNIVNLIDDFNKISKMFEKKNDTIYNLIGTKHDDDLNDMSVFFHDDDVAADDDAVGPIFDDGDGGKYPDPGNKFIKRTFYKYLFSRDVKTGQIIVDFPKIFIKKEGSLQYIKIVLLGSLKTISMSTWETMNLMESWGSLVEELLKLDFQQKLNVIFLKIAKTGISSGKNFMKNTWNSMNSVEKIQHLFLQIKESGTKNLNIKNTSNYLVAFTGLSFKFMEKLIRSLRKIPMLHSIFQSVFFDILPFVVEFFIFSSLIQYSSEGRFISIYDLGNYAWWLSMIWTMLIRKTLYPVLYNMVRTTVDFVSNKLSGIWFLGKFFKMFSSEKNLSVVNHLTTITVISIFKFCLFQLNPLTFDDVVTIIKTGITKKSLTGFDINKWTHTFNDLASKMNSGGILIAFEFMKEKYSINKETWGNIVTSIKFQNFYKNELATFSIDNNMQNNESEKLKSDDEYLYLISERLYIISKLVGSDRFTRLFTTCIYSTMKDQQDKDINEIYNMVQKEIVAGSSFSKEDISKKEITVEFGFFASIKRGFQIFMDISVEQFGDIETKIESNGNKRQRNGNVIVLYKEGNGYFEIGLNHISQFNISRKHMKQIIETLNFPDFDINSQPSIKFTSPLEMKKNTDRRIQIEVVEFIESPIHLSYYRKTNPWHVIYEIDTLKSKMNMYAIINNDGWEDWNNTYIVLCVKNQIEQYNVPQKITLKRNQSTKVFLKSYNVYVDGWLKFNAYSNKVEKAINIKSKDRNIQTLGIIIINNGSISFGESILSKSIKTNKNSLITYGIERQCNVSIKNTKKKEVKSYNIFNNFISIDVLYYYIKTYTITCYHDIKNLFGFRLVHNSEIESMKDNVDVTNMEILKQRKHTSQLIIDLKFQNIGKYRTTGTVIVTSHQLTTVLFDIKNNQNYKDLIRDKDFLNIIGTEKMIDLRKNYILTSSSINNNKFRYL